MCVGMMMSHCVALNVESVCELRDCVCVCWYNDESLRCTKCEIGVRIEGLCVCWYDDESLRCTRVLE